MKNLVLLLLFAFCYGCGPSNSCKEECKDTTKKFECQCECDPLMDCGLFEQLPDAGREGQNNGPDINQDNESNSDN